MELFGIGPGELMLIMVLAFIIVGPQKLPEIGRQLGQTLAEFKAQTDALRSVMTFDAPATVASGPIPNGSVSYRPAAAAAPAEPAGTRPEAPVALVEPAAYQPEASVALAEME